ncbi:efflux RND transporter permease subunit [Candidatus Gracilibacteria bacterium]|nr:efflux RND transporter permease subunit [Candidatus Gracilibacteria bacterium]
MQKLKKGFFTFWVENYKVSFLLLFLITVVGLLAVIQIPKESSPDIKFGIIAISTRYEGVNPVDIDSLITDKIEKEIEDIDGISKITSNSSVGMSSVTVELENGIETRDVLTDIKDKVDALSLPSDADDSIVQEISTQNELLFEALIYGSKDDFTNFSLTQKARQMQANLEGKSGIASIDFGGAGANIFATGGDDGEYEIRVLISKEKIELLGLNISNIASILRAHNKNTPLGNFDIGDLSYDFRVDGEFKNITQLENTIIRSDGGSSVRLKDISTIEKKYSDESIKSLGFYESTGFNYVTLSFNKRAGDNIFKVSKSAKNNIQEYLENTPGFENLSVKYTQDLGEAIIEDYQNLGQTALQTLVLVFITIFVFVGFRESMIASMLLSLAFFITFIVLNALGYSLNFLTNFSLVLTLGIAIDTIIVIIEGSSERQKLGYTPKHAVILAVRDLKSPLISGTMTTLVAFLPMIFLPGIMGKFLSYIPITVFITLLGALILSLTLASALFYKLAKKQKTYISDDRYENTFSKDEAKFLKNDREGKEKEEEGNFTLRERFLDYLGGHYYKILYNFLKSRKTRLLAITVPFILLILSFVVLSPRIGFTLFPASDEGVVQITIEGQNGAKKETMEKYIPLIEEVLSSYQELKVYYVSLSGNKIDVYIELIDAKERQSEGMLSVFDIERDVLDGLIPLSSNGLLVEVAAVENGPPTGAPVGVKLEVNNSKDINTLKDVAEDFKLFLQNTPGTKNASTSSGDNPGQFVFTLDRARLSFNGLSPDDILLPLRILINGIGAGSISSQYEDNDIKLLIGDFEETLTPEDIENIIVQTQVGDVRIGDYVSFTFEPSLSSITRENGKISISADSGLEEGTLPSEIQPLLIEFAEGYNYPDGVAYSAGGENEENAELIQSTLQSFLIAIFLIFLILVLQFNSYSQPIIILYSVVLALLGVNIGLFVTGNPYSMTFAIGFIALTGVVVNDAIILVDRINRNLDRLTRNSGDKKLELDDYVQSLVAAGKSRLQPIIVTTLTTVFGIFPLALQDAFWAGLGYTMIFGLMAGSLMTLFVIPALYYTISLKKKMN